MTLGRSPPGHGCRSDILKLSNALSHSPKDVNGLDSFKSHKGTLASISAHVQSLSYIGVGIYSVRVLEHININKATTK